MYISGCTYYLTRKVARYFFILYFFNVFSLFPHFLHLWLCMQRWQITIITWHILPLFPFSLDMFFHIANLEREVYWQIGNVCCSAYPIEQLDTINSKTGELNTQSALNLIVFGVSWLFWIHSKCEPNQIKKLYCVIIVFE